MTTELTDARAPAITEAPATQRPRLTLILPAHNEEARIERTLRSTLDALRERYGRKAELMVVANGCTDGTLDVVERVRRETAGPAEPVIEAVNIEEPVRKGGAVVEGFRRARGDTVVFADADGSTDPRSLLRLADGVSDYDIVIGSRWLPGSRIGRAQPLRRRLLSRLFNTTVRLLFGLKLADTQCGAKALRREAARALADRIRERDWTFDVELLLWARRLGLRVAERPVAWSDADGSNLSVGATATAVASALLRMWRRERLLDRKWPGRRRRVRADHGRRTPRRRRILALNWRDPRHPEAGGAEVNLFEQARRWKRSGASVTVLAARRAGDVELPPEETIDGVRVLRMGGRFTVYPHAAWFLLRHGRRYSHILDVANGIPFFAPLFARRPATLLVHHVHDRQWFTELPRPLALVGWFLERAIVPLVYQRQAVIAVSPTTRDALVRTGLPHGNVEVVYNGVSASEPEVPRSTGDGRRIAYVGRLKRYKRLDRLVRMFAALRTRHSDLKLDIAGEGDARPDLEAAIEELGLRDAVTLHGRVDETTKAEILSGAVAFATPSMQEGWGLSVIEANHYGCPAVAYDVPGLSAAIRHGETGLLAADDDAFRDALEQLIEDPGLRHRLSGGARRWAARFGWDATARATLEVLDRSFHQWRTERRTTGHRTEVPGA